MASVQHLLELIVLKLGREQLPVVERRTVRGLDQPHFIRFDLDEFDVPNAEHAGVVPKVPARGEHFRLNAHLAVHCDDLAAGEL